MKSFSRRLYQFDNLISKNWCGFVMLIFGAISGLRLHLCKFYGLPVFVFHPHSSVIIGKECTFRSSKTSNLIGINHPCSLSTFSAESKLIIGDNCGFSGTVVGCFKEITIGDNVRCGANTVITDGDWHQDDSRSGDPQKVTIGRNVWLGLNSIVLKGVTIGENTVIGAGSIVTKDIPADVIAAGNPCKVVRALPNRDVL